MRAIDRYLFIYVYVDLVYLNKSEIKQLSYFKIIVFLHRYKIVGIEISIKYLD